MSSTRERDATIRQQLAVVGNLGRPILHATLRAQFKALGVQVDQPVTPVVGSLLTKDGKVYVLVTSCPTGYYYVGGSSLDGLGPVASTTPTDLATALADQGYTVTKHTLQSVLPCE